MKNLLVVLVILLLIASAVLLPFHYIIGFDGGIKIFAKENLSLSYTFITNDTVDKLINRHNNASNYERLSIRGEYLFIKLMEEGIIGTEDD